MHRIKRIHFVGIAGVGMSGIAEVLLNLGYAITGSDVKNSPAALRLRELGAVVNIGHASQQVLGADVVVRSTAIDNNNPELLTAREKNIPIVPRAEMLAELMRFKRGIAVAGTHGKTTTTSLIASLLATLDPTYVIGGKLQGPGHNASLGQGEYFIAEADESDASFLSLKPMIAVVTNIDGDHMSTYQGDFNKLRQTFIDFLHHLPFYGLAVLCLDDPEIKNILDKISRPRVTYGFNPDADFQIADWSQSGTVSQFMLLRTSHAPLQVNLNLPGKHNALNAAAAIAVATELGIPDNNILTALEKFAGIGRRFQQYGEINLAGKTANLIDDYAHHPREIEVTIAAMRQAWPDKRLLAVFQPHRYSRTEELFTDFAEILSQVDELILLDIYPADESPLPGITSAALLNNISAPGCVISPEDLSQQLMKRLKTDDIVMTMGAGSIGGLAAKLAKIYGV